MLAEGHTTERRRRPKRRLLHAVGNFFGDLPLIVSQAIPRLSHRHRRPDRSWKSPRRIAVLLTALTVVVAGGTAMVVTARVREPLKELWRLHDQAVQEFEEGRFEESAETCRRILALDAADPVARFNLGAALVRLARTEEGLREISAAARERPDMDAAHLFLAREALARGADDAALEEARLVVANPPSPGAGHALYASLLRRRGRDVEAMPHLRAAFEDAAAEPLTRIDAALALGRLHGLRSVLHRAAAKEKRLELELYGSARSLADETLARAGDDLEAPRAALHAARATALMALSLPSEALVDVDLALKRSVDPATRAALHLLRAQVYWLTGDLTASDKELEVALAHDAKPPAAAFRDVAAFYAARARVAAALSILDRGTGSYPGDVELGMGRAALLFRSGRADDAEAECERVAKADARSTAALLLRGDLRRARGDLEGARRAYAEALSRDADDVNARLRLAGTAFSETGEKSSDAVERLAEAERLGEEALAASPDHPGALLALAKVRLARASGSDTRTRADPLNKEARDLLARAVERDPFSLEAHTFLAYADARTLNPQEAALGFERVLASLPEDRPPLRGILARCYLDAGNPARAAEEAQRTVAALPGDVAAWSVLQAARARTGDYEGALEASRRLEALEPRKLRHLFDQALLLGEIGRTAAAEERFAAAEEIAKGIADEGERAAAETDVASVRADFYRRRGDFERAKGALGALVAKGPASAGPYVRYARLLLNLGQKEDAEREAERAIAVEPSSLEARRMLCEIWFSRGEPSPVLVNQVQEVARIAPKDVVVDYLQGKLAMLQGDLRMAKERLTRYVAAAPEDPDGFYALGISLAKAGEFEPAVARLERAGELVPGSPDVRVALAKTRQLWAADMLRRGRFVEAQAALRRALSEDPAAKEARILLADTLHYMGDVELSEKEVRALLHTDPTDRAALRMLSVIQANQGRPDDTIVTLRRLLEAHPGDWDAWSFLSTVLVDRGDFDGAEVAAKAARKAAPHEPASLRPWLHVLLARGDTAAVEKELAAAAAASPNEPQYVYYLAVFHHTQGRHEAAAAAAGRALDIRPAMPLALHLAIVALQDGLGDSERAAAFARERVARARDDPMMTYLLAMLETQLGRGKEALRLVEPLCAQKVPLAPALALRVLLLLEESDFAAARDAATKGIEVCADSPDLHYLMAQCWLADPANTKDGEVQEPARGFAVTELRAVTRVSKLYPAAWNNLAWLLSRDEATRGEAMQLAEAAAKAAPKYAPYLDTYATCALRAGRTDVAVTTLRRALGLCEEERVFLEKRAAEKLSAAEARRVERLRRRLERTTAEVRAHHDAALKASGGR